MFVSSTSAVVPSPIVIVDGLKLVALPRRPFDVDRLRLRQVSKTNERGCHKGTAMMAIRGALPQSVGRVISMLLLQCLKWTKSRPWLAASYRTQTGSERSYTFLPDRNTDSGELQEFFRRLSKRVSIIDLEVREAPGATIPARSSSKFA